MNVRSGRLRLAAVTALLVGAAALATACSSARPGTTGHGPVGTVTASAARNGVQVTAVVSADRVSVTYQPQRPGFHLYSITMPSGGADGLGVPTRLRVQGGLRATGPPTADQPVRLLKLRELGTLLPVYPDGPVTITLPIARTGSTSAQVVVSYGACSASTCLLPVAALILPIRLD